MQIGAVNRFGFALQLCALRYPGRLLASGEVIPPEVTRFLGAQLGLGSDALAEYATRSETRRDHLIVLRHVYGFRMFSGHRARELKAWLAGEAENATTNHDLARRFVDECRRTQTILPGISVIERLCADALVAAERRIDSAIVARLDEPMKARLDALLTEMVEGKVSRFVWGIRPDERFTAGSEPAIFLANIGLFDRGDTYEQDALCGAGRPQGYNSCGSCRRRSSR